jgi:hypothetical protein
MQEIDGLLQAGENNDQPKEVPLSHKALMKQKLFTYFKPMKEGEEDVCSVCL